jgi:hypothetical protein
MSDIDRPRYLKPSAFQAPTISRPTINPDSGKEDEDTDDDRTLADAIKNKKSKASQGSGSFLGGDPLPSHPEKPRVVAQKCKAGASPSNDEDQTPS